MEKGQQSLDMRHRSLDMRKQCLNSAGERPTRHSRRRAFLPLLSLFTFLPFYLFTFLPLLSLFTFTSCTTDPYESGDTSTSYLRADFVEAHTVVAGQFDRVVTDDGVSLSLSPYAKADWATTADSTYRALLYYNKVENGTTESVAAVSVPVLNIKPLATGEQMHEDPVTLESSWVSKSGKYLNLGLLLKTGVADGVDNLQKVGVVLEDVIENHDGTRQVNLRFYHEQNGVPEYYSSRVYVSIPLNGLRKTDVIRLTVNPYQGEVVNFFTSFVL